MNGRNLLDTNNVIALFANDRDVGNRVWHADEIFIPSIVLGELYFGAHRSVRSNENLILIDEFASSNAVLGCDSGTARHYGQIKDRLRSKGRPIPENDVWIAAIAFQHGSTLVSRDVHFEQVDDLELETW